LVKYFGNLKIKIYITIILPVVFMGVKPGLPHERKNTFCRHYGIGSWGRYLGPRE